MCVCGGRGGDGGEGRGGEGGEVREGRGEEGRDGGMEGGFLSVLRCLNVLFDR